MIFITEKHEDTYVSYPAGKLQGIIVGQGATHEASLANAVSAVKFHAENFGADAIQEEYPALEVVVDNVDID